MKGQTDHKGSSIGEMDTLYYCGGQGEGGGTLGTLTY